ncbi:unnamed protein product [Rotaria sordida]|uniref:Uncharacterized protein n=1 Tax=Rotaria sordida TaxID=392033 RepID=A0A819NB25_9BILA|nr:unnamed protein product [Rotaria sordida]CAF3994194.1 unnamed protein product [Rotaria sordida]
MNRILIDLRNRLTTEHLEQLMRISIEGPSDLDNDLKDLIIDCWKTKLARINTHKCVNQDILSVKHNNLR